MKRQQLMEIEDQDWCPTAVRNGVTDTLATSQRLVGGARVAAPLVQKLLRVTGERRVIDVCSGAGGPLRELARELTAIGETGVRCTLTDKFPNLDALGTLASESGGAVDFISESVDATDVPADLHGVRTQFASFHHFAPDAARSILADCVRKRQAVGIFEYTSRDPLTMLSIVLIPFGQLFFAPFQRPFSLARLLLTYLLPAIPFVLVFDGLMSCFRSYDPDELRELTAGLGGKDWVCEIDSKVVDWFPVRMTSLLGYPKPAA